MQACKLTTVWPKRPAARIRALAWLRALANEPVTEAAGRGPFFQGVSAKRLHLTDKSRTHDWNGRLTKVEMPSVPCVGRSSHRIHDSRVSKPRIPYQRQSERRMTD